ncbi:MAG: ATP-binding protein [Planctomycetota bacterium]|jgi:signal transduction histidine kinase
MHRGADPGLVRAAWQPNPEVLRLLQEELSLAASSARDFHRALLVIIRRLCGELDWDFGEAWVRSRDGTVLKPGPVWPRSNPAYVPYRTVSRRLGFLPGSGLAGRAWLQRAPIGIADIEADSGDVFMRRTAALRTGFRRAVAIPLLAGEEDVVAVVVLYRCEGPPASDAELETIRHTVAPLGPVVAQKRIEVELFIRERQQKAVAHLGMVALAGRTDIDTLMEKTVRLAAATLGVGHGELLECVDGERKLRLRAGVGWGGKRFEVPAGRESQAGYTLDANEPVIVSDIDREQRFAPTEVQKSRNIVSGLSVIVYGHASPFGVLAVHSRQRRSFTRDDVHFLQAMANVLGTTIERNRVEAELAEHRQHLETLVARRTAQLDKSHERLRLAERLASVGTLAAGLGHDLGNTILPVLCRLDALAAQPLPDGAQEDVAAVRHAVEYLRQLSQGLRHFALDRDGEHRSEGVTRLGEWWKQASPLLRTAIPKRVRLESDLPENLPPVALPPNKLSQAVLNLVANAAEAIDGEGKIRVVARPFGDEAIQLSISDDGRGMTPEARRHAMEPFFTTKTRGLSTGLGLAIVHGVTKGAGGEVEIESTPGEGTTIHLTLPTALAPKPDRSQEGKAPDAPFSVVGISLHDRRMAAYASLLVRSAGLEPRTCPPGQPGKCRIWIAEPGKTTTDAARTFLEEDARRRVVLFGESAAGSRPGFHFVDRRGGPDAMRRGLREVVFQVLEEDDEQENQGPLR